MFQEPVSLGGDAEMESW